MNFKINIFTLDLNLFRKMNKENQSQRLQINDHFDNIINEIDIKTETLLENVASFNKKCKLEHASKLIDRRSNLNEIRDEQIEKIKEIKEINLNLLQKNEEELDLEKLIHFDCVLVEEPNKLSGLDLWLTFGFYNQKNLEFLR